MKSTPSPRVRFLAVLALILFAGGVAYLLIHSSSGTNSASNTAATNLTSSTTTQTHATTTTQGKKPEKKKKKKQAAEGTAALDAALVNHPLVVVSVYAQNVVPDTSAMEEARAGAAEAGAGFVAFNVYDEKVARQLGDLLGSGTQVESPAVLFFKRPRKLAFTLQGYSDSQVVAQAAQNVFPHVEPWVNEANLICDRYSSAITKAENEATGADRSTAAGRNQAAAALKQGADLLNKEAKALSAVRANASKAKKFAQLAADLKLVASNLSSEAAAIRRNDIPTAQTIDQKNATLIETMSTLASELQLTSCVS
jgi:hypothetical protein